MSTFIQNLKEKASKRLNLVKCLATTSWGANKSTLRQIYLGYVRSAMDYAMPIQAIASKSTRESLDKVQNQSLRLVCGGLCSTQSAACEIDANVEPLGQRRGTSCFLVNGKVQENGQHPPKWKVGRHMESTSQTQTKINPSYR